MFMALFNITFCKINQEDAAKIFLLVNELFYFIFWYYITLGIVELGFMSHWAFWH